MSKRVAPIAGSRDPHHDPSKPSTRERMSSFICGDCGQKVTAPTETLKDAADRHFAVCPRKDATVARH